MSPTSDPPSKEDSNRPPDKGLIVEEEALKYMLATSSKQISE